MRGFVGSRAALGLIFGFLAASAAPAGQSVAFDTYEVVLGTTERQTVLTGFLLDGPVADLAVVSVNGRGVLVLEILEFDGETWKPALQTTLGAGISFVDVVRMDGRDRLVAYEPGLLSRFDPRSASLEPLVRVSSGFDRPREDEIPHVDISQDVNRDGRDDLVVPGVTGFHVLVQTEDGGFADALRIGPPVDLSSIYGPDGYRYDPWSRSRVYEVDHDRDGLVDLVFLDGDRLAVHRQEPGGRFRATAETFDPGVDFDSDDIYSLASGDMTGRVLHSLADVDGDGVADLVVAELEGSSASSKRSRYEVHLGAPDADRGTVFSPEADRTFRSDKRVQVGMDRQDLDGDGDVDLLFTTIETRFLTGSLWKKLKGMMGDDVWLELEFWLDPVGGATSPATVRRIALDGAPSHREPGWVPLDIVLRGATHAKRRTQQIWPRAFNPTLLIGDVTGDRRADLIMEHSHRELHVYPGIPGRTLFARQARIVRVPVPGDREYSRLVDLDRNGKLDILLHHPFTEKDVHGGRRLPPGSEPQRVTVLLAR